MIPRYRYSLPFRYRTIVLLSLVIVIALPAITSASSASYSVGPSFSYVLGADHIKGSAVGLDVSLIPRGRAPWWLSLGLRSVDARDSYAVVYGEFGLGYLGVGYSHSFGGQDVAKHQLHGYVGIPIPIYGMGNREKPGFYFAPYYRPSLPLDGSDRSVAHEVGILIKFTTVKVWAPPPWNSIRNDAKPQPDSSPQ